MLKTTVIGIRRQLARRMSRKRRPPISLVSQARLIGGHGGHPQVP